MRTEANTDIGGGQLDRTLRCEPINRLLSKTLYERMGQGRAGFSSSASMKSRSIGTEFGGNADAKIRGHEMYLAELHGKLSSKVQKMEDVLTSNVFSFLKYSEREVF